MDEQNTQPNPTLPDGLRGARKSIYKRWWFWLIILLVIAGGVFGVIAYKGIQKDNEISKSDDKSKANGFEWPSKTAKYITNVPVDLTQIQSISKYRSCAGHVRDGYNFDQELELDRSMKHYLYPISEFQNTNDKIKIFAPFDGTIIKLDWEEDKKSGGRPNNGNGIHLSPPEDLNVDLVIGHMYFTKDFSIGDKVKAGELLGYAATDCQSGEQGCDFDIDLSTPGGTSAYNDREVLGSAFDHMTDSVLAEFAKYGITPENTKFSKEYRDANLCGLYNEAPEQQKSKEEAAKDFDGHHNDNHVQLKH